MKTFFSLALALFSITSAIAQEVKTISDCTIVYDITVTDPKADATVVKSMSGSTKVVYLKGSDVRTDLVTPTFIQTTLYNSKSDSTVVLRELGPVKYITYLNNNKKAEQNKKYEGIQFSATGRKKTILGYETIEVVAKLTNGSTYNVFYAPSITPGNKMYEYQFSNLPGLVFEYEGESEDGKTRIKYSAMKINLLPVPNAKFDLPKSGYRILQ